MPNLIDDLSALTQDDVERIERVTMRWLFQGGKYAVQTKVKLVGGIVEQMAERASLYLYDRRIWVKDAAWENSRWHTMSYRSVDEFEYVYIFWKPGSTVVDRDRLRKEEWIEWGSRAVWHIASVRANDDHEAKFPLELPRRLIRLLTGEGDLVLDCFVGSGTTAVAAILEGRHYVGIDKERRYVEMARRACTRARDAVQLSLIPEKPAPVWVRQENGYTRRLLEEETTWHKK